MSKSDEIARKLERFYCHYAEVFTARTMASSCTTRRFSKSSAAMAG